MSWNLTGRDVIVCPPDCPRRCAEPNCHNAETCETWARYEAQKKDIRARRREYAEQYPRAHKKERCYET